MAFQAPVETSSGKIRELTLGSKKTVAWRAEHAGVPPFEGRCPTREDRG